MKEYHIKAPHIKVGDNLPYPGAKKWGKVTKVYRSTMEKLSPGGYKQQVPCIAVELDDEPVWNFGLQHTTVVRREK